MRYDVELSAENLPLASVEANAAAAALGGTLDAGDVPYFPRCLAVHLHGDSDAKQLGTRLALARRVILPWPETTPSAIEGRIAAESARNPVGASFRHVGRSEEEPGEPVLGLWARAWRNGGGHIDLERPDRRFLYATTNRGAWKFGEEIAAIDRDALSPSRYRRLPYQKPVTLAPRLARVAANLARLHEGDRVTDPFVGTGALLIQAGLLGARVEGVDRDPEMVRGAIANLAHMGLDAGRLTVADAGEAADAIEPGSLDAVLTDPPYGRASGTHGEKAADLVRRVLPIWADRVRVGGRVVAVLPGGPDPLSDPWRRVVSVPDRVHRSLTREFRVYERAA
ncbi:MAG: RsmD family RNA methyltransferase [Thermoplasmata archaeon]|nr:RsmD family RNA methyltransferase [Thermoplasmata archaeon]